MRMPRNARGGERNGTEKIGDGGRAEGELGGSPRLERVKGIEPSS